MQTPPRVPACSPQRAPRKIRRLDPPHLARPKRAVTRVPTFRPAPQLALDVAPVAPTLHAPAREDAYTDYARHLTPQGGILIIYKDLDQRPRHTIWRIFAWSAFTGIAAWIIHAHAPANLWVRAACFIGIALVNWLIVRKPVEVYRTIEIRPDCLILEGADVFWREKMEGGLPSFENDEEGNQVFCGIYGTRLVEYLTIRRFDEYDRAPEVIAAHLQDAMQQLWERPDEFGPQARRRSR